MGWKTVTGKNKSRAFYDSAANINLAIKKGSLKIVIKDGFAFSPIA